MKSAELEREILRIRARSVFRFAETDLEAAACRNGYGEAEQFLMRGPGVYRTQQLPWGRSELAMFNVNRPALQVEVVVNALLRWKGEAAVVVQEAPRVSSVHLIRGALRE
jgi:hypothetical protein